MYNELTQVDIDKMQQELKERSIELRAKLSDDVKEARSLGDLSENAEYRSAKRAFCRNESRIRYLEKMIRTATVITIDSKQDEVGLFDKVTIYYEETDETEVIRISTMTRLDIKNRVICRDSAFGKSVLGKKVGDRILIKVNEDYSYYVVIKNIEKGFDDDSIPLTEY